MKILKNGLMAAVLSLSGCYINQEYVRENRNSMDNLTVMEVYVPGRSSIIILPCRNAGVRFEPNGYSIRCNSQTFFSHSLRTDYLQFGNVSYLDYDQDGNVDRISFNDSSLEVNNYSINSFYQEKLNQLRRDYVRKLWEEWLSNHPDQE